MLRFLMILGVALLAEISVAQHASAQAYPSRTVKFILPFGPASGTDVVARMVGEKLSARWGKPVVIENRPGGDGLVSINAFTAANDDHTLLWVPVGIFAVHPFEREKLPYDADRDLLPIVGVTSLALAMSAPESLKTPTLRDFIAQAKANPGKFNAAAASGNADFLLGFFLKSMNLDIAKVPYRDIMQGPNDLAEGRIQLLSSSLAIVTPLMQAGKVRIMAVTSKQRMPSAPDVPTVTRGRLSGAGDGQPRRHLRTARHAARDPRDASLRTCAPFSPPIRRSRSGSKPPDRSSPGSRRRSSPSASRSCATSWPRSPSCLI